MFETKLRLNLQLFANPNTNTTEMNGQGQYTNDLSPTMKTFYDTSLLENSRAALYFNQFGKKQALPKNGGNKVEWRKFDTYNTDPNSAVLTEGVTPNGNLVNMTRIEAPTVQYGAYTTISDRLELEAVDPIIMGVTEEHGAQAGEILDRVTRDALLVEYDGLNVIYGQHGNSNNTSRSTLTAEDVVTPTLINQAVTVLKKNKTPQVDGGGYIAIIHPSCTYDLRQSAEWLDVHKYAQPDEIYNGEIGKLHNVRFIETTQAKVWNIGTAQAPNCVYAIEIFGKDAYGIIDPAAEGLEVIVKQRGSAGTADPLDQRSTVGWKATHAAKVLYPERIVRLEVGSFYSNKDQAN